MIEINIKTVPHSYHRYETVGDWEFTPHGIDIRVSDLPSVKMEFAVAIHEAIEAFLCQLRGITEAEVNAFDIAFESARVNGDQSEPGDSPSAPYRKEHFFATSIERLICAEMGLDWKTYEEAINSL